MSRRSPIAAIALCMALAGCSDSDADAIEAGSTQGDPIAAMDVTQSRAAQSLPEWLPADFPLPEDFSVESAQEIGQNTKVLNGSTDAPLDGLYESLSADLENAGYQVRNGEDYADQDLVYFEGKGCEDCTIRITDAGLSRTMQISLSMP